MLTSNPDYVILIFIALLLFFIMSYKLAKYAVLSGRLSAVSANILCIILGGSPLVNWVAHMEYLADSHDGYMPLKLGFFIAFVVFLFVMRGFNKLRHEMEDRWK